MSADDYAKILQTLEQTLNNNVGNRITSELGTGIYLQIKEVLNRINEDGDNTRADSSNQATS